MGVCVDHLWRKTMSDYAVINPATGETPQDLPDDHGRRARGGHRRRLQDVPGVGAIHERRGSHQARAQGRRAAFRAARGAGGDHRPRDGQAHGAGAGRGRLLRRHLRLLRRQRRRAVEGRADQAARRRGHGDHPPQLVRRAARHHAVELPDLSGRPVRRPEPGHREHRSPEARAAVPGDRRGPAGRSTTTPASPRAPTPTSTPPTTRRRR